MRRLAAIALAVAAAPVAAPAAPAAAAGPRVDVLVVGRDGAALAERSALQAARPSLRVGGKRCRVDARTPLGLLVATRLALRARDLGSCGSRPRDAGSVYVVRVGRDRAFGRQGWVYKVGRRTGTTGAGDVSGPFGTGRLLRTGDRLTWFWCVLGRGGGCQRTLVAAPSSRSIAAGGTLTVRVRGYDDNGRGRPVAGARVALGGLAASTDAAGVASFADVPAGAHEIVATRSGMVRSFSEEVVAR